MKRFPGAVLLSATLPLWCGCGAGASSDRPDPVERLMATSESALDRARGEDVWEVAICRIPIGATDPLYAEFDDRMEYGADEIVEQLAPVSEYYERWSGGRYTVRFVPAAADVSILTTETSQQCVDRALGQSSPDAQGVLVVSDAQHAEGAEGGRGGPGTSCDDNCSATVTRRYVYVGASDFMSVWEGVPPLDLIEHELGHGLDWPHSSLSAESLDGVVYDSPYDLMSNSAASRETDATLRHGPGILVVNLLAAGWIDPERIVHWWSDEDARTVDIVPRSRLVSTEPIAVAIPVDDASFYSVEVVGDDGDDAFHGSDFVLVHRVEVIGSSGFERRQYLVSGELHAGDTWNADGFTMRVLATNDGGARVEVSGGA